MSCFARAPGGCWRSRWRPRSRPTSPPTPSWSTSTVTGWWSATATPRPAPSPPGSARLRSSGRGWATGIHFNLRLEDGRLCCLVLVGVRADGTKELVAVADGERESGDAWAELLRDCRRRGMRAPVVMVGDGALGLWRALGEVFPATREQRCWVHKVANVLNALPKSVQAGARRALNEITQAEDHAHAERAIEALVSDYGAKWPKAVAKVVDDREALLCFFDYPAEHWLHLRTTDESFKALVALPAGPGAVRLGVGRGRPRSEEQGLGAGSPAAQLCPLEGLNVVPQWWRPRPCLVAAWLAASAASRRRAGGRRVRPARPVSAHAGGPLSANTRPRCPSGLVGRAVLRGARASAASCRSARAARRRSPGRS